MILNDDLILQKYLISLIAPDDKWTEEFSFLLLQDIDCFRTGLAFKEILKSDQVNLNSALTLIEYDPEEPFGYLLAAFLLFKNSQFQESKSMLDIMAGLNNQKCLQWAAQFLSHQISATFSTKEPDDDVVLHLWPDSPYTDAFHKHYKSEITRARSVHFLLANDSLYSDQAPLEGSLKIGLKGNSVVSELVYALQTCSKCIIHSLSPLAMAIISKVRPKRFENHWVLWGYDYVDLIETPLLLDIDKETISRYLKKDVAKQTVINQSKMHFVRDYISGICCQIPYYHYAVSNVIKKNLSYMPFRYPNPSYQGFTSANDSLRSHKSGFRSKGLKVLIGNSGTFTNNYISAIERLNDFGSKLKGLPIFITLSFSYGGQESILKEIIDGIKSRFQYISTIDYQEEYLSKEEFCDFLAGFDLVFMNHLRPQAYSTIKSCLQMGVPVVLNRDSALLDYLRYQEGLVIFDSDDTNLIDIASLTRLDISRVNQEIVNFIDSDDYQKNV